MRIIRDLANTEFLIYYNLKKTKLRYKTRVIFLIRFKLFIIGLL